MRPLIYFVALFFVHNAVADPVLSNMRMSVDIVKNDGFELTVRAESDDYYSLVHKPLNDTWPPDSSYGKGVTSVKVVVPPPSWIKPVMDVIYKNPMTIVEIGAEQSGSTPHPDDERKGPRYWELIQGSNTRPIRLTNPPFGVHDYRAEYLVEDYVEYKHDSASPPSRQSLALRVVLTGTMTYQPPLSVETVPTTQYVGSIKPYPAQTSHRRPISIVIKGPEGGFVTLSSTASPSATEIYQTIALNGSTLTTEVNDGFIANVPPGIYRLTYTLVPGRDSPSGPDSRLIKYTVAVP